MTDENKAAVQEIESDGSADLSKLTETEWSEWEKTGEMPKKEEKPATEEKSAEESKAAEEKAAESDDKPKSDSSSDTHKQERKPTEAEKRIKELLGKVASLEDENSKLKTPKEPEKKAESRQKPTMQDKNVDGTPKYPATDAGFEKYTDDMLDWKQQEREAKSATEKAEKEKTDREAKVAEVRKKQEESWRARVDESKKKHDDFEDVAFQKDIPIVEGSLPDQWFLRSPMGSELLYYFGQNKAELKRINDLSPDDQLRELVKLEDKLAEPAANKVTRAAKIPSEVGARKSATTDPVNAALENDDFDAYAAEQNRLEIAQKGGKRK